MRIGAVLLWIVEGQAGLAGNSLQMRA